MMRLAPIVILALAVSQVARADAPPAPVASNPAPTPEPVRGQRSVGIGAELGLNTGVGPALHVGTRQFGLYVAAGLMPIFIVGKEQGPAGSVTFDVYRSFELNTDVYAMFLQASPRTDLGLSAGYSGNTFLGNGINLGITVQHDLGEQLAFTMFGGFEYFPDARDHLIAHAYPATQDTPRAGLQGGVNFGLVFYP